MANLYFNKISFTDGDSYWKINIYKTEVKTQEQMDSLEKPVLEYIKACIDYLDGKMNAGKLKNKLKGFRDKFKDDGHKMYFEEEVGNITVSVGN